MSAIASTARIRGVELFPENSRIWRAVETHGARALQELDAIASNALGDLFPLRRGTGADFQKFLAQMLARDLTAVGIVVHDSSKSVTTGGVWLAPCPDGPGVIAVWTQHDASAAVLGSQLHRELQETMNFDLCVVLRLLGYTAQAYGTGESHVVTARHRAP